MHPTARTFEVFPLSLMDIDRPGCTTAVANSLVVIHSISLALDHSGVDSLKEKAYLAGLPMPVFSDIHKH